MFTIFINITPIFICSRLIDREMGRLSFRYTGWYLSELYIRRLRLNTLIFLHYCSSFLGQAIYVYEFFICNLQAPQNFKRQPHCVFFVYSQILPTN